MSDAPNYVWIPETNAEDFGVGIHGDICYRRADIPWLPQALIDRAQDLSDSKLEKDGSLWQDRANYLIGDILAACERKDDPDA